MGLDAPSKGWVWVTVPVDSAIDLVVVGEPQSWYTHWYRPPGCKRADALRCVLDERGSCDLCRAGYERRVRYVLPVELDGEVRVVEFGAVQYPTLAIIQETGGLIGSRLRVTRERPVRNAPIRLREVGREVVPPERLQDIEGFVAAIGQIQTRLLSEEAVRAVGATQLQVVSGGKRGA